MVNKKKKVYRQIMTWILIVVLFVANAPEMYIGAADVENVKAEKVIYTQLPEEETTRVEVFSQDGSLKHVDVSTEDFEDVPADESAVGYLSQESEEKQGDNSPVRESSNIALPAVEQLNFTYEDLINNGSDSDNYCILIAGDGYTASEQSKFLETAQKIANYFMTRTPFNDENIKNKINIRAVCTVSNQTGVSMDPNNLYDTFFKSSFNNAGIERLVCIHDQNALDKVIQQYMPECNVPIVVCNSKVYGGSGGSVCVISDHDQATDIAFHEFGHTGGELADEYWETTTDSTNGYEAPNRTSVSDPTACKWADLIGVNGVGLYAFDENPAWYRPHQNCEMRYLNQEFCEVCKRQIRYKINSTIENKVADNEVIYTAEQLVAYATKVSAGAKTYNKTVTLANDITLTGTNNIPVMHNFDGTFNGNGHVIRGININSDSGLTGFIGTLGANGTVSNLAIESANIIGNGYYVGGIVGNNKGTIYGCSFEGYVNGYSGTGGIAGHSEGEGIVRDCYNRGRIYSTSQVSAGIVGWLDGGSISNCYNYGAISVGNSWYGAVCGYNPGGTVSNCYYLAGTATEGVAGNGDNGAVSKSQSDFENGTVTALLNSVNSVWKQGGEYPVFTYTSIPLQQGTNVTVSTDSTWIDLGAWSYYFGSWNGSNGSYTGGSSANDFTLQITGNNKQQWGIQIALDDLVVTSGHSYQYTLKVNSSTAGSVASKDDISNSELVTTNLNEGVNTITGTFTASANNAKILMELSSGIEVGTTLQFTEFTLEDLNKETETTTVKTFNAFDTIEAEQFTANQGGVIDTNSNASGGYNIGGVLNGTYMQYDNVVFGENAKAMTMYYSSPSGIALGNAEIYVDSLDNKVGTLVLANNGSSWQEYGVMTGKLENEISSGTHTIFVKYVTTGAAYYVANVDYFKFVRTSDYVEETTTEEPTTAAPVIYSVKVDGTEVATVEEGETYTFPKTAKVGYYGDGKLYKKGSTYTVTKDIEFYSVGITAGTGASIKWTEPSGMRFSANLTCSDTGFYDTSVKKTGMLIAPYDFYSEDGNLDFTSEYIYLNVENSGWTGKTGTFGGALASISPNNYKRMYIARAYVTVEYADGSEAIVYSNMSGVRSVGGVAQTMKDTASVYNNLSTAQKALIETYILGE